MSFGTFKVGQLLRVKTDHSFVKLHPQLDEPTVIWEALKTFWENNYSVRNWGERVTGMGRQVPKNTMEWVTAIKMECAWDMGAKEVHQRDLAKEVRLDIGDMLMVMEIIVTPWKKRYRRAGGGEKRQRFSYVKFLATQEGKAVYLHHDTSHMHGTFRATNIDENIFELLS